MVALLSLSLATVSLLPTHHADAGADADDQPREVVAQGELVLSTVPSTGSSEQTLLLTIGPFRYRLLPHLTLSHSSSLNTYTLPPLHPSTPALLVAIPFPSSPADSVDQTTLRTLLSDYLSVLEHNPAGLRGKLLLIDEDTGEVLGEMETGALELEDDTHGAPGAGGKEQGPVVLDLENLQEGKVIGGIKVTEVPKDEMDDWMLKGASNLSKNLLTGAGWMSTKLQTASDNYVARATPRSEPVIISDATRARLEKANTVTLSGKDGVKKVTGFLNRNIQRATEYTFDKGQTGASALDRKLRPKEPPKAPTGKRPLVSRLLLAGDVLLTTVEAGSIQVLGASTQSATKSIAHKYGDEAGEAAGLAGGSVRNVGVAFVDARGVGRKALLKGAGKSFVKNQAKKEAGKSYALSIDDKDVEAAVAGAQEKEGELILSLNSGAGGNGSGPPAYGVATQRPGKGPPPRPPTSTKPGSLSPAAGQATPPAFRSTSPSQPSVSPASSRSLSPLPPPPRRNTPPSTATLASSTASRSGTPPSPAPTAISTGWRRPSPSPSSLLAPTPLPPPASTSPSTDWRRTPPPPLGPSLSSSTPPPPPLRSAAATPPAPRANRSSGWTRPPAPDADDFEGVRDALGRADVGGRAGTPPAPAARRVPPPPPTASKPATFL